MHFADVAENVIFLGMKKVRQSEMTPDGIKLTLYISEKGPSFHLSLVNVPVRTIKRRRHF